MGQRCTFLPQSRVDQGDSRVVGLSGLLEEAVLQLRKDVPLELVVNMFQKLVRGLPCLLIVRAVRSHRTGRTCDISCSRKRES